MRPWRCWLVSVVVCATAVVSRAEDGPPREALDKIKAATVLVRARVGAQVTSGTGFVIQVDGNAALLVTNRQLVMPPPLVAPPKQPKGPKVAPPKNGPPVRLEVVLNSGSEAERAVLAKRIAVDNARNLAVLRIDNVQDLPRPLDLSANVEMTEEMSVFVLGFPSGAAPGKSKAGPAIAVSKATVSNPKEIQQAKFWEIHADGELNAGNSGGPVVDAKGRVVGAAVVIGGSGRAIPAGDLFNTRVTEKGMRVVKLDNGAADVEVRVQFSDPLNTIVKAFVRIAPADSVKEPLQADKNGRFLPLPNAQTVELKMENHVGIGVITMRSDRKGPVNYYFQPSYVKADASITHAGASDPQAVDFNGSRVRSIAAGAGRSPACLCWSEDAKAFYHLDGRGTVRRFRYPELTEEAVNAIGRQCKWISLSSAGLIATVGEAQEAWLLDPKTLKESKKIAIGKAQFVVSSPKLAFAYAAEHKPTGGTLTVLDLAAGKPIKQYKGGDFEGHPGFWCPIVSADGQYLFTTVFTTAPRMILRFKINGAEVTLADATDPIIRGRCDGLSISNEGDYVCAPSGRGNQWDGGYATFIYASSNLKKPASIVSAGANPLAVGFDFKSGLIYAHNSQSPLIVCDVNGVRLKEFTLANGGTWARPVQTHQFLVHPAGRQLLALCEAGIDLVQPEFWIFAVELPADGWGTPASLDPAVAAVKADLIPAVSKARQLETARQFQAAALLYEKALVLAVKALGENHQETEALLSSLGTLCKSQGKYAESESHYRRSLAILEKLNGQEHLTVANALLNLGDLCNVMRKPAEAEPFFRRGLAMHEKLYGAQNAAVADSLNNLAEIYVEQGNFAQAEPLYRRSLAIHEKINGKDHLAAAIVVFNLANSCRDQGKSSAAEALYQRSLAIKEKALGADHLEVAGGLNNLGIAQAQQAKNGEAAMNFERSLAIKEKALGKEHPDVAPVLNNLASVYHEQGKYAEAEALLKRSLAIREKAFGQEHPLVSESLNNLANVFNTQGKYTEAESLHKRSLAIKEKTYGKEHPTIAISLGNLATIYFELGRYADAEPLYQRSLTIREKAYGPEHPDVAFALNSLANLYRTQGKYAAAEPLYLRCLSISEKALGKEHPAVGNTLQSLAVMYWRQGKHAAAEPLYQRSLAIKEKVFGKEHPDVANALAGLANLYKDLGKHAEAEALDLRSLAIREKAYGKDHPRVADALNNLAILYMIQGKFAAAEPLYRRCLTIYERTLGAEHPSVAGVLNNMVSLYRNLGKHAEALRLETRLRQNTRQFLLRELPSLSAAEQRGFLEVKENALFASALMQGFRQAGGRSTVEASAAWLLNGKAIALEAQTIRSRLEREITDAEGQGMLGEIQAIRAQEAVLAFKAKQPEDAAEQREKLETRRRVLEKKLAQQSTTAAKVANPWAPLAAVRAKIPADGVLIDIVRFRLSLVDNKTGAKTWAPHYVAWLIPPGGDLRIIDLGDAAAIDAAVQAARQTLENTVDRLEKRESEKKLEADATEKLAAVAKLVFDPLKPHLGIAKQLILSPDGDLWLLPWAALPTGKDRYLIEDYSLRFVVTGRDLVDYDVGKKPHTTAALILADPDYNLTPTEVAQARPMPMNPDATVAALTRSASDDLRGIGRVKRLPGTVAEAKQAFDKLKTLTGQEPKLYQEAQASETIVKATRSPRVLVLATHGFFMKKQEVELPDNNDGVLELGGEKRPAVVKDKDGKELENPLLRCGLLLAGANKRAQAKEGEDDGILTGLEIVGLDLRGTQMVVLSACETAVGEVQTGEGVAGLRQAFQLAGAESVLATLWQISDSATGQLMNTFYDELAKGTDRAEALTLAQRQFIKERRERAGAAHPFFWASFTLTGK